MGGGKGVGTEIPHSAGLHARFSILTILFIHVSISITIMITITIKITMGIPNGRRMRRPYSCFLYLPPLCPLW